MEETRYRRGLETARNLDEGNAARLDETLKGIAPDLHRFIVEFAFGDILSRPGLPVATREIVTLSALSAMGTAQPQLRVHINAALNVGVPRTQVVELFMQIAVYAGIPAALNALYLAKEVFAERDAKGLS
ncbi:MAG: carboxymuconolactone decarboxylase family protein [Candidatus Deferrimicrobiaceae bacterium]